MPFDIVKVATSITLSFLAISLYLTVTEHPSVILYKDVPLIPFVVLLIPIIMAIIYILKSTRYILERTKLRYWTYIRLGLFIHIIATFYVLSLIAILWNGVGPTLKLFFMGFWIFVLVFYTSYARDMHNVVKNLGTKPPINMADIVRYGISLYSAIFLIFFGIGLSYKKDILDGIGPESFSIILLFILIFLIAYVSYISVPHKGFEEILKKNVWTELSYAASAAAFITVYLIYSSLEDIRDFPLSGLFFIAYLLVLGVEILSIRSLGKESRSPETQEKEDVQGLLNYHTKGCVRADLLENTWDTIIDRYDTLNDDLARIRLDPSTRSFDLDGITDERLKVSAAVGMLLEMYKDGNIKKISIVDKSREKIKEDIESVLEKKILLLENDLLKEFDSEKYFPPLFESTINKMIEDTRTFIPFEEQKKIFKKLARIGDIFKKISFKGSKIEIPEDERFSRSDFIKYFKMYLYTMEDIFPFEYVLLYGPVKAKIIEGLLNYGFSAEDLIDIVPTGFKTIDQATDGGLPKNTSTLLLTEETKLKSEILYSFFVQGMRDNDIVIFVTSKKTSDEVYENVLKEVDSIKNSAIIDLYQDIHTTTTVPSIIEKDGRLIIPANLTLFKHSIVRVMRKYQKETHKRVVIDAYHDLLKLYSLDEVYEIMAKHIEGFRKWNCTTIITIEKDTLEKDTLEELKKRFDNVLILTGKGKRCFMIVEKLYSGTPEKEIVPL